MWFAICFIVFFLVDTHLFKKGYDTFFWSHKTTAEKEIQKLKIKQIKKEIELEHGS